MEILQVCQQLSPNAESIALKDGGELILMKESSEAEFRAVLAAVAEQGFAFDSERKEGEALFATYEKDGQVLLIS